MLLMRFFKDDHGSTAIEYALIGGIISLAILTGMTTISTEVQGLFTQVQQGFDD